MYTNLAALNSFLEQFVSTHKQMLFDEVIKYRTRYITLALEDIYQPHNASAVLRTCDCFGIQDVHIIENKNQYMVNPDVALGASKWLSLIRHNQATHNTKQCIGSLREEGYRIVATSPHTDGTLLHDFEVDKGPVALFFGTEMQGLSDLVLNEADEYLKIPMYGFTESFNISVSAAIILQSLSHRLHLSKVNWQLSGQEQQELRLDWLKKSIKKADLLIKDFIAKNHE